MAASVISKFTTEIMILLGFFAILCHTALGNSLSNGWGDNIDWVKFDDGVKLSKESGKPLMLVIHKSWCGACKSLKPLFAQSKEIEKLSKNFVMVNTLDDAEPDDSKYSPDGGYIPRILFQDSEGNVNKNLYNQAGNAEYKFYYYDPEDIGTTMKAAIKIYAADGDKKKKPDDEL
ncbi:thioredoxin domain-containing protein 12-like [Tubulanus polymorphus]|uniref:thioredoxin domain-containing protein 12-like n=1 Tax=Tubulanus polymorphus TaxID=672921 RepID=UPI003DA1F5F0